jgi:folate-binding protein YgfZ
MTEELHSIDGTFLDLSAHIKLRVAGNDRLRFLNGQITADIRKAGESNSIQACLLDTKGRMTANVSILAAPDHFLLAADPELGEALQSRVERYIIADDVSVEDVSNQWSIFHCIGETAPTSPDATWVVSARRFARPGWDIWVEASHREKIVEQLSAGSSFCDSNCAEVLRIEQGVPRWGRELTNEIIPIEANLEESCIDYDKGCYVGQEVISRMKMSGQRNKKLCGLISTELASLTPGMRLLATPAKDMEVGWITSACHSARLSKEIALGFVKRGFNSAGTKLEAAAPPDQLKGIRVEVVELPFTN